MRHQSSRSSEAYGFTLIEIVIALTLLTLVLGVAYQSLTQIMRSKKTLDDQRDATVLANGVLTRMTRELQLAYFQRGTTLLLPPDAPAGAPLPATALIGEPQKGINGNPADSITFLAMEGGQYLPDGGTHSGLVQIRYRVEPDQQDSREGSVLSDGDSETSYLIRDEFPFIRPPEEAYKKTMTFPITGRLTSLAFQYFDSEKQEWTSTWDNERRGKPPGMIKFSIGIKSPLGAISTFTTAVPIRSEE